MKILITKPDLRQFPNLFHIAREEAKSEGIFGLSFHSVKFTEIKNTLNLVGVIIQVSNDKDYQNSLELIRKHLYRSQIPYIYIVSEQVAFDFEQISQFFPDQVLVGTVTEATLRNTVQLFLLKVQQGYYENGFEQSPSKRIWISLKKGVYQSLEIEEIKYVEAADHYVKIFSEKQRLPLIKSSLRDFHEKYLIKLGDFLALNRSYVINTSKIQKIENNHLYIDLDKPLSIPRGKRTEVLKFIGL